MKLIKVRLLEDLDTDRHTKRGMGATFGVPLKKGGVIEVEDYGSIDGKRHLRYFPKGSTVDTRIPADLVEVIEE